MLKYHLILYSYVILITVDIAIQDYNPRRHESKSALVEEILHKLTKNIVVSEIKDKDLYLKNIKKRLTKIAQKMGPNAKKYVDLVMQGILVKLNKPKAERTNMMMDDNYIANDTSNKTPVKPYIISKSANNKNDIEVNNYFFAKADVKERLVHAKQDSRRNLLLKEELLRDMVKNMELYAKVFNDTDAEGVQNKMIEKLKKQLTKITVNDNAYVDKKTFNNPISRAIEMEKKKEDRLNYANMKNKLNSSVFAVLDEPDPIFDSDESTMLKPNKTVSMTHLNISCDEFIKYACPKIRSLDSVKCNTEDTSIFVENVCDGVYHCHDGSDEWNCTGHVLEKVYYADVLLGEIQQTLLEHCKFKDSIVTTQKSKVMHDVLLYMASLIKKQKVDVSPSIKTVDGEKWQKIKKTGNQIANVIHTLSDTLNLTLCRDYLPDEPVTTENHNKYHVKVDVETTTWTPSTCVCNPVSPECLHRTCRPECEYICFEAYSVGRWECDTVSNQETISLDVICDGKIDCIDESDESGCTDGSGFDKFAANTMFDFIQQILITQAKQVHYEAARQKLVELNKLTKTLQQLCVQQDPDKTELKEVRNRFVSEIVAIFKIHLYYSTTELEMVTTYTYLRSVMEKLVSALKRSNTGNEKVIPTNGCYCKSGKCVLSKCSNLCVRACSAEPKLTQYFCDGQLSINNSVAVSYVCDGKKNCLGGDDELGCSKDVCRNHHLVVLRHELRNVGQKQKGTALGDALISWRKKTIGTLLSAEDEDRPTPPKIKGLVNEILRDLLITYSSLKESKNSSSEYTFYQFFKASRYVMNILKSCGQ